MGEIATTADGDGMTPERFITMVRERQTSGCTQDVAGRAYAELMGLTPTIDWTPINAAIVESWSRSGLKRVKHLAWRRINGYHMPMNFLDTTDSR